MNAAYIHLLLNHIPVIGTAFGILVMLAAVWRRNRTMTHVAYATFIGTAIVTIAVFASGQGAEDVVEDLPGVSRDMIEEHEESGMVALGGSLVLGVIAAGAAMHSRRTQSISRGLAIGVSIASFVVAAIAARTASLGGVIRHPEIRAGVAVDGDDEAERKGRRGRGGREGRKEREGR